jgi:hypothetical protein
MGLSVSDVGLFAHLTDHAAAERELLDEYIAAAKETESKALAYLVNLLIEDELRHHKFFEQLAQSLRMMAELGVDPVVPNLDFQRVNRAAVLDVTGRLLKRERADAAELKRLQRELSDVKDTTLWSLLVDVMRRDTEKHIAILRFVEKHA